MFSPTFSFSSRVEVLIDHSLFEPINFFKIFAKERNVSNVKTRMFPYLTQVPGQGDRESKGSGDQAEGLRRRPPRLLRRGKPPRAGLLERSCKSGLVIYQFFLIFSLITNYFLVVRTRTYEILATNLLFSTMLLLFVVVLQLLQLFIKCIQMQMLWTWIQLAAKENNTFFQEKFRQDEDQFNY